MPLSGKDRLLDQRRDAVAVFAVEAAEVGAAPGRSPGTPTASAWRAALGVIDAEPHRRIGALCVADALVHRVGGPLARVARVRITASPGTSAKRDTAKPAACSRPTGGGGGAKAAVGDAHRQAGGRGVVEGQVDQHQVGDAGFGGALVALRPSVWKTTRRRPRRCARRSLRPRCRPRPLVEPVGDGLDGRRMAVEHDGVRHRLGAADLGLRALGAFR